MAEGRGRLSREEAAMIEVGHTDVARPVAWCLIAAFLAVTFSVPVAQNVWELARISRDKAQAEAAGRVYNGPDRPQYFDIYKSFAVFAEGFRQAEGTLFDRVWAGNAAWLKFRTDYEDTQERRSWLQQLTLPPVQEAMLRLANQGNENVYKGLDGWLFYRPGLDHLWGPPFLDPKQISVRSIKPNEWTPAAEPDPRPAILHFRDQLARRGKTLIIMPTTLKGMVYPDRLSRRYRGYDAAVRNPSNEAFRRWCDDNGVIVFDPTDVVLAMKRQGRQVFLRTDTHWTPEAMQRAAARLARLVEKHLDAAGGEAVAYAVRLQEVTNLGDNARALRLPEGQTLYEPETVTVRQVLKPSGELWSPDGAAEVLLLGDSFSNIYSYADMRWGEAAGFGEQLSYALRRPVDILIENDNGSFTTRERLRSEALREGNHGRDRLARVKVVVWQFAARELSVGNWRTDVPLPAPPAAGAVAPPPRPTTAPGELVVTGTVSQLSDIPRPNTGVYVNRLMSLYLTGIEVRQGNMTERDAVLYMWGLRDNRPMPPAGLNVGDRITVRLVPWRDVKDRFRAGRNDLDDIDLLEKEPWWAEMAE